MNKPAHENERTRALLSQHYKEYPELQAEDIFKYLFHSALGCEHLVTDEPAALHYIQQEFDTVASIAPDRVEPLDGAYSRVHLGVLHSGLRPQTLARLFLLSAKKETDSRAILEQKLTVASEMIEKSELPLDARIFAQKAQAWRAAGFPAVHHSATFRQAYHPAYRVIANEYAAILPVLTEIDKLLTHGSAIIAIDGGSAAGKTTLADTLQYVYGSHACNVFHTDDFFLRPEQRIPERLAEVGGNLDRERFAQEIVRPLRANAPVTYRRFDCMTQTLGAPTTLAPTDLTVVEGAYSMHPAFGRYYDLAIFLNVDPSTQKKRIARRNVPQLAKRFFDEWIPLENEYFSQTDTKCRADLTLSLQE